MSDFLIDHFLNSPKLQSDILDTDLPQVDADFHINQKPVLSTANARPSTPRYGGQDCFAASRSSTPLTPGPFHDISVPRPVAQVQTINPAYLHTPYSPADTPATCPMSVDTVYNDEPSNLPDSWLSVHSPSDTLDDWVMPERLRPHHDPEFWSLDTMLRRTVGQDLRSYAASLRLAWHERTTITMPQARPADARQLCVTDASVDPAILQTLRANPRGQAVIKALEQHGATLVQMNIGGQRLTTHDIMTLANIASAPAALKTLCDLAPRLNHVQICHEDVSKDDIVDLLTRKKGCAKLTFLVEHQANFGKLNFNDAGFSKANILHLLSRQQDGLSMLSTLLHNKGLLAD